MRKSYKKMAKQSRLLKKRLRLIGWSVVGVAQDNLLISGDLLYKKGHNKVLKPPFWDQN